MPIQVRDDQIPRSVMLLCLGTAALLGAAKWGNFSDRLIGFQSGLAITGYSDQPNIVTALPKTAQPNLAQPMVAAPNTALPKAIRSNAVEPIPVKAAAQPPQAITPTSVRAADTYNPAPGTTKVIVKLDDRRLYLYQNDQVLGSYAIAVGQAGWETPTGNFRVLDKEKNPIWVHPITGIAVPPGADNPLGKAWIGFWSDGQSEIGFHGTNQEELIGQAVSHGCLRMRNEDIEAIFAKVSEGTPVIVQQ